MNTAIRFDVAKNRSFGVRDVILPMTCRQSRRSDRDFMRYNLSKQTTDHGARLEIHQDGAGHVAATSGLVVVPAVLKCEENKMLTIIS